MGLHHDLAQIIFGITSNVNLNFIPGAGNVDPDFSAFLGKLDGVVEQVSDDLRHPAWIAQQGEQFAVSLSTPVQSLS